MVGGIVSEASIETVEGTVHKVVYAAADGLFAVVRIVVAGRPGPVTVVGPLGGLAPGEIVRIDGTWERHPAHGDQLRAERAVAIRPRTSDGVSRYLEGLKGIGPTLAKRLVAAFGTRAVEVLEEEPWRAAQVPGVGKRRAGRVADEAKARREEREVMVFLQGQGVSAAWAARIRKVWGDRAITRLRENPYLLAREVPGIGFHTADQIARGMGIDDASPLRIEAGLYDTLEGFADGGHLYAPRGELLLRAGEALHIDALELDLALLRLVAQGAVILEDDGAWLPRLHAAEQAIARRIGVLLAAPRTPPPAPKGDAAISALAALSAGQKRAVDGVRAAALCVITGGPGTGKTTVVKAIVASWHEARRRVLLAAPTGRAAKRLAEATGRPAQTVHRLLEWGRGARGRGSWGRDESRPLEADLVVIDESSMLDVALARALLQAVPPGATVVLVGDVDQLPSVGPGQVLADVIASGVVPVARLTEIFRQGAGSAIIHNAHQVLAGHPPIAAPPGADGALADFYVLHVDDPVRAREMVVRLCKERIPKAFGLHPSRDIQVLTPMHRGEAGTEALNRALQEALNKAGALLPRGTRPPLRVGDKVMQSRNDYDRDVFNGDLGEVVRIDPEGASAEVLFDDRRVAYDGEALSDLDLAYAVSIHKSQGSEYPAVVVTLLPQHFVLLRRNLLYTAITRGKRLVVLVGAERAIRRAVDTADAERRYTRLRDRLASLPI
ncbi:MAG: ATP-dependent RecD-like DNA helicase [Myxococcales bacterium]|nr:ATP-dependent RecD-like DNA helicase [Myxococcales bacterium]